MKYIYWLLLSSLFLLSCNLRKPDIEKVKKTKMEVVDPERHYYPILRGSKLSASYKIYNKGNEPLIIYDVQASCGCIDVSFSKSSIGINEYGFINVDYDSAKNIGYVEFYIMIRANTEKNIFTTIKFDLNVITSAHYTKDYEEIYFERKEKTGTSVDGDLTQQGYYLDNGKAVK